VAWHAELRNRELQGFGLHAIVGFRQSEAKVIVLHIVERASGISVGDAGLILEEETGEIHVGDKIARSSWGKGLATPQAWVAHGFDNLGLRRIAAFIHPENTHRFE
jgi:RimJ/RimL family protein N-acetyltransferase